MPYRLSKSRFLSGLQCPKRLWLEVHRPELVHWDPAAAQRLAQGHRLNAVVQGLYPEGVMIEAEGGLGGALRATAYHLQASPERALFEATFSKHHVLVRADVLERTRGGLRLTEVKSAALVKDYHLWDCAVQAWVIEGAGHPLDSVVLAHVDTTFVYPGAGDYRGLLAHQDVTAEARARTPEVAARVPALQSVLAGEMPKVAVGPHCTDPFTCPFLERCTPPGPEYPVTLLPRGAAVAAELLAEGYADLREVPPGRLASPTHEWVRRVTASGVADVRPELPRRLRALSYPRYYLDFEAIQFAVPIWAGTRPYEQLPFQWSCHVERAPGVIEHAEFLDTSGENPLRALAEALLAALGETAPVLVYSGFERQVLRTLAAHLPDLAERLEALAERLVDLLPLVRAGYYHPAMKGSWSIKAVLPTVAPELDYSGLGEVQDGIGAQGAYLKLIDPVTPPDRSAALAADLRRYCALDTLALQRLVDRLGRG